VIFFSASAFPNAYEENLAGDIISLFLFFNPIYTFKPYVHSYAQLYQKNNFLKNKKFYVMCQLGFS
jgi:hypothetical protein